MFDALKRLLPIPSSPFDVVKSDMTANQTVLGAQFPDDYIAYSLTYGSGTISVGTYSWDVWSACCPSFPAIAEDFFQQNAVLREALETFDLPVLSQELRCRLTPNSAK